MTARVEINPNLRLDGDYTMVDLDEDVEGDLQGSLLELVQVYAPGSGLVGRGWVTKIDRRERTVTVLVEWSGLSILDESKNDSESAVHSRGVNRTVGTVTPGVVLRGANLTSVELLASA